MDKLSIWLYKIANIAKNVPVISMNNKTLIILPAYNEELTIGSVVALAKKFGDVLVVDDGSAHGVSSRSSPCLFNSKTWRPVNE